MRAAEENAGIPPRPDAATEAAYLAALGEIEPDLVRNKERGKAVDRGRNQCSSVKSWPDDRARLVKLTQQRFSSASHPDGYGAEKSGRVLDVVRKYLCPGF